MWEDKRGPGSSSFVHTSWLGGGVGVVTAGSGEDLGAFLLSFRMGPGSISFDQKVNKVMVVPVF